MKKRIIGMLITVVFLLNLVVPVFATEPAEGENVGTPIETETDIQLPNPGILPDSPVYFFDTLLEKIIVIFTFSPDKKAGKLLAYANERLAEADALAAEGKQDQATQTAQIYLNTLEAAQVQIIIAVNDGKVSGTVYNDVYSVVSDKKNKSVVAVVYGLDVSQKKAAVVLLQVLAKAPEQARKGLLNAFANVVKHQLEKNANIIVVIDGQTISMAVYNSGQRKKQQAKTDSDKLDADVKKFRDKTDAENKAEAKKSAPGQQKREDQDKNSGMAGKNQGRDDKGKENKTTRSDEDDNGNDARQTFGHGSGRE